MRQNTKLSSIIDVERFYMEEDMKGRERENFPLSLNIMNHTRHTSIIELNLGRFHDFGLRDIDRV